MKKRLGIECFLFTSYLFYINFGTIYGQDTTLFIPVSAGAYLENEGNGTFDFSFGQLLFLHETGSEISINQGIQQPIVYELASKVESITCDGIVLDNSLLLKAEYYSGVMILPYLGGNGANFLGLNLFSEGVKGLSMSMQPGKLVKGNGSIELTIKGIPIDTGLAIFNLSFGNKSCVIRLNVTIQQPELSSINCNDIEINPVEISKDIDYIGEIKIKYSGGNNVKTAPVFLVSSGVIGLSLVADSILLNSNGGILKYQLLGKPTNTGIATLPLMVGGKSCPVLVKVIDSKVIEVSNFFSPNGDGVNDHWSIPELAFYPEARVYIFDKHGKLLIEYPGKSVGWNGILNEKPAPIDSYWYLIKLTETEILKGNFTLMR